MKIGPYEFDQPIALAPMAGISDRPMRVLARRFGADYAVSEMVASKTELWTHTKARTRLDIEGEDGVRIVQIAGSDPATMAHAAQAAVSRGAQVIDINMGCPAKKVCNKLAGSALLSDERLVGEILLAVVAAVAVPVTLKTRTGPQREHRNGVVIARLAEDCGVSAITMHGRTRACKFRGAAEYDTIAAVKQAVTIPVIANGDIVDAAQARHVLDHTGADGLMIGRAAQGRPWLFGELKATLAGVPWRAPGLDEKLAVIREHLSGLHLHYGERLGVPIARKHIGWYFDELGLARDWRRQFNGLETADSQRRYLNRLADTLQPGQAA